MAITVHVSVFLPGLRSGILGGAFPFYVVERNGLAAKDRAQALRWLDSKLKKGILYDNACPSPEPNGKCPGHPKES